MRVDIDSIMSKLSSFASSSKGKAITSNTISNALKSGKSIGVPVDGRIFATKENMIALANQMINIMKTKALESGLPQSVLNHFNSLSYSDPVLRGNQYSIDIFFTDDLSRNSLLSAEYGRDGERTGEGISNIVSLFDTGYVLYKKHKVPRGIWEGHEDLGVIRALGERKGLRFMDSAIADFNSNVGSKYNVFAEISKNTEYYSNWN